LRVQKLILFSAWWHYFVENVGPFSLCFKIGGSK
jgi:hypothetical protein